MCFHCEAPHQLREAAVTPRGYDEQTGMKPGETYGKRLGRNMAENRTFQRAYLIGSVIVWVGIWLASAVILQGTPYFAQMLPILGSGMVWFVILIPGLFFWDWRKSVTPTSNPKRP